MTAWLGPPQWLTLAVAVAAVRLAELMLARRNTARLLAAGGVEHGAGHYPLFFLLHGGWIVALLVAVPVSAAVNWWLIALYGLAGAGRYWSMASLGGRWTTRIIVLPDAPPVRGGPYRWLRHPNYLAVALEIPLLPAAFGAWHLAAGFGLANLALLAWRIRAEERAWRQRPVSP
jgi:methyltransferase